ncbi:MAG: hypothetical protein QOH61_484 [Chloroflexota bacterium]|nr:hypothetical protein [Chloroflexota bacterium]
MDRRPGFDESPTTPTASYPAPPPPPWKPAGMAGSTDVPSTTGTPPWTPGSPAVEPPRRSGRARWIVALAAAVILVTAGIGIAVFALGARNTTPIGPTFLPASTAVYAEARLDLPGTQRDSLVKLLSHFPGFADQAAFDQKVDEVLDRWVSDATGGLVGYARDIKPWFGGQAAVGLLQMPSAGPGSSTGEMSVPAVHVVAGLSVKDRAALDKLLLTIRVAAGASGFREEGYGSYTLVTVSRGDQPAGTYTVTDTLILFAADASDLKQSLDVLAGTSPSLGKDPAFVAAMTGLPQDRLGALYTGGAVQDFIQNGLGGMTGVGAVTGPIPAIPGQACLSPSSGDGTKASTAAAIVAAGDHVSVELRATGGSRPATRTATDLAAHMPADTQVYLEMAGVGTSIHDLLSCLRTSMPDAFTNPQVAQIEQLLGTKLEDYLSFVTDVGVGASFDGAKFRWGVTAAVSDEAMAQSRVTALLNWLRLGSSVGGLPVNLAETQVNGVTVTTISLSDPRFSALPIDPSVSVAATGGHLYIGGGDFAAAAIGRTAADSLAGQTRFTTAVTAAGNASSAIVYADVAAIREQIELFLQANGSDISDYATNVQPYLAPFDRAIVETSVEGEQTVSRILVFVK